MSDTAQQIRAILKQHGWTQKRLADALGVSERTVRMWLAGQRNPSGPARMLLNMLEIKTP